MKVYLDACCLSRLTDDQSQPRIRDEAEAIEQIFCMVKRGIVDWISSEVLRHEVSRNPSPERRLDGESLLSHATRTLEIDTTVVERAKQLAQAGYSPYDALHLAAAESAHVDVLLSTDDRFLKRVTRGIGNPLILVKNPLLWIQEHK